MSHNAGITSGLHADDLELARRCAAGEDAAWERFVREYRPVLYRAADALDPSGNARELADSLYADLYGDAGPGRNAGNAANRRSLFRYFQGRSSLATWLRAVLAQRYVDFLRTRRRLEPLPDDEGRDSPSGRAAGLVAVESPDPERPRALALVLGALGRAVARLESRDRLGLNCYYVQQLTLAETGRLLGEHEATASRRLARIRRRIREEVERDLRDRHGLTMEQVAECFDAAAGDPGSLDLNDLLADRKKSAPDRSLS